MSLLAALLLAAASARVESINLTTVDARLAVRVLVSGTPGMVAVHREGNAARVSIMDTELGLRFAGGRRFTWTPADGFDPALLGAPARLDRLDLQATASEVSLTLHVPPEVSIDVRRIAHGLLLAFREAAPTPEPARVAQSVAAPVSPPPAAAPPPTAPAQAPAPKPVVREAAPPVTVERPPVAAPVTAAAPPITPAAPPVSSDTLELAKRLFPAAAAEAPPAGTGSVADLYPRLFPTGAPQTAPEEAVVAAPAAEPVGPEPGVAVGPFRVKAGVDARFLDADTFLESTAQPTRDKYLEVAPRVVADAPVSQGRLTLDYAPTLRGLATYDQINSNSQRVGAALEVPLGPNVTLRAKDAFLSGLLESREVDPGGEYFFGLGRFHKNAFDAGASIAMGSRLSLELAGAFGTLRFQQSSDFFSYDTRLASAGLGFELTPNLKAVAAYVYDQVPRPAGRPEAESRAHSATLTLSGDILPLLTGQLSVGYRNQDSPNAGEGGTRYSGLTVSAKLSRQLGHDTTLILFANRSTPASAFENNGFYVATALQGALQMPLPLEVQLSTGLGYQWSDYRTVVPEIGQARQDRILGWSVGLRRPIRRQLFLAGSYRHEKRSSNLDQFDTRAESFALELQWNIFGATPR
jgi:hypothetical protein